MIFFDLMKNKPCLSQTQKIYPVTFFKQTFRNRMEESKSVSDYQLFYDVPLPKGWDFGLTHLGKVYFICHLTQTTQWEDPRTAAGIIVWNKKKKSHSLPLSADSLEKKCDPKDFKILVTQNSPTSLVKQDEKSMKEYIKLAIESCVFNENLLSQPEKSEELKEHGIEISRKPGFVYLIFEGASFISVIKAIDGKYLVVDIHIQNKTEIEKDLFKLIGSLS